MNEDRLIEALERIGDVLELLDNTLTAMSMPAELGACYSMPVTNPRGSK